MTAHTPGYRTLASLSRINLLFQLQQRGTMTVGDLSEAASLHPNTVREHLDRLIIDGYVTFEIEHRETKGRPRLLYSAATGADHGAGSIREAKVEAALRRAEQLRSLFPGAEATAVPPTRRERCAPAVQRQLDALDDHLDQSGFDAEVTPDQRHVHLRDCPYAAMVKEHPEVCHVHLGLIRGVLDQAGGPLTAEALHPHEEPNLCTIDLEHAHTAADTEPARSRPPEAAFNIHGVLKL